MCESGLRVHHTRRVVWGRIKGLPHKNGVKSELCLLETNRGNQGGVRIFNRYAKQQKDYWVISLAIKSNMTGWHWIIVDITALEGLKKDCIFVQYELHYVTQNGLCYIGQPCYKKTKLKTVSESTSKKQVMPNLIEMSKQYKIINKNTGSSELSWKNTKRTHTIFFFPLLFWLSFGRKKIKY